MSSFAVVACSREVNTAEGDLEGAPGQDVYDSDAVACDGPGQCGAGEACVAGVCRLQRCASSTFKSTAPLGRYHALTRDREIIAVEAGRYVDAYQPGDSTFARPSGGRIFAESRDIVDLAGGRVWAGGPELAIVAEVGSTQIVVSGQRPVDVGFAPVAVDVGDLDDDGIDEIIAVAQSGQVAVCHAEQNTCEKTQLVVGSARDVAVGDVDGDGHVEIAVLGEKAGQSVVGVWNRDAGETGQPAYEYATLSKKVARLDAGDLTGDGISELVALEIRGGIVNNADHVIVYTWSGDAASEKSDFSLGTDAHDVVVDDWHGDDKLEVAVLDTSSKVHMLAPDSGARLSRLFSSKLSFANSATRIAAVDFDDDSAVGELEGEPELVPGDLVPLAALMLPPYSRTRSDGRAVAAMGSGEETGESQGEGISLGASLGFSVEGEIPGIVKVTVGVKVGRELKRKNKLSQRIKIEDYLAVSARPEIEGPDNGAVMVGCGCFHNYRYALKDKANRFEGAKSVDIFVPVGGQTQVWGLKRYNAMAKLEGLPEVHVPYTVGDPGSYPTKPVTLGGQPIPREDYLFPNPVSHRVSDTASRAFKYSIDQSEATEWSETRSASVFGSGKLAFGIGAGVSAEITVKKEWSYEVSAGRSTTFAGAVPPLRDDPSTPEDEYRAFGYSFTPIVYRERYVREGQPEATYLVMTYVVGP